MVSTSSGSEIDLVSLWGSHGKADQDLDAGDLPSPQEGLRWRTLRLRVRGGVAPPGRQHKETFRTLAEAREAQGKRRAGDGLPSSRVTVDAYFSEWIETYAGRTPQGLSDRSRSLYRRAISERVIPEWGTWRLGEVEPVDVRRLYGKLREAEVSTSVLRLVRAATSAMFATAVEDGILRPSPVAGVRIPAPKATHEDDEPAKALTKEDLRLLLRESGTTGISSFRF